jgi:hypothetical protein
MYRVLLPQEVKQAEYLVRIGIRVVMVAVSAELLSRFCLLIHVYPLLLEWLLPNRSRTDATINGKTIITSPTTVTWSA